MIGSLTVLPALLSKLGDRGEGPHPVREPAPEQGRRGSRLGRDPRPRAAPAARLRRRRNRVLLAPAAPAIALNTASTGIDDISHPSLVPLQKFDKAFPGGNELAAVAIKADDVTTRRCRRRSPSSSARRSQPDR